MKTLHYLFTGLSALTVATLPAAVAAQSSPAPFTAAQRYDEAGRATGTIAPDPDGTAGPLKYAATRTTIDNRGLVTKVETGQLAAWQSEDIDPANWTGFEVLSSVVTVYDSNRRKISESARGSNGVRISLTQYSYDNRGRLECTAVRMNPATYGSLPADACTHSAAGAHGPDRITRNIYDDASQIVQIRRAVNTDLEIAEVTYSYTDNGKMAQVIDANGNRAVQRYDEYDRMVKWVFPAKSRATGFDKSTAETALTTAGPVNETDYEEYEYDANGNRTTLRKRDGSEIDFAYDALNRVTHKTVPVRSGLAATHTRDIYYTYDNRDLQTSIRFDSPTGEGSLSAWDGFGQQISVTDTLEGANRTLTYRYDANGNRTSITHPDNQNWRFEYDGLNRANVLRRGTLQIGLMSYNKRGLVEQRQYPYSSFNTVTTPSYDVAGRTTSLAHDLQGTAHDIQYGYSYIPSGQLGSISRDNEAYSWDGQPSVTVTRDYTTNGLNQYDGDGFDSYCYDANGNLTADGAYVYLYDIENRLVEMRVQGAGNTTCTSLSYAGDKRAELRYDPLGRLYRIEKYETLGGANPSTDFTRFLYDGDAMVAEYNAAGTLLRRYVHGTNTDADDPLIWYEGAAVNAGTRRNLMANHQGSIIAVTSAAGAVLHVNAYDAYGVNGSANVGRFQYTGQAWLAELGMYYYKARIYSPRLGRFLQTDPIGYEDQFNLYAYVGNDPVNLVDPTGMEKARNWRDAERKAAARLRKSGHTIITTQVKDRIVMASKEDGTVAAHFERRYDIISRRREVIYLTEVKFRRDAGSKRSLARKVGRQFNPGRKIEGLYRVYRGGETASQLYWDTGALANRTDVTLTGGPFGKGGQTFSIDKGEIRIRWHLYSGSKNDTVLDFSRLQELTGNARREEAQRMHDRIMEHMTTQ